ncbi:MAG: hypothetical protein U1E04_12890 [Hylemonella sp.]|nr:hypothetical protein [Hylemonella sp.]
MHGLIKLVSLFLLFLLAGCPTLDTAPAAQTPTGLNVLAVLQRGSGIVNVGRDASSGTFEILPVAPSTGEFQLYLDVPYPSSLRVRLDGTELPRFEAIPSGTDPAVSGFYRIVDINPNPRPARWHLIIRPPMSRVGSLSYTLAVSNITANTRIPAGSPDFESAPLIIALGAQRVYRLSVASEGSGSGRIGSTPAAINCGSDCSITLGQSQSFTLTAQPAAGSRFIGWTSNCPQPSICNCAGNRSGCSVTLNGAPVQVNARFEPDNSAVQSQICPGPRVIPGFSLAGNPGCASGVIDQHPSAMLACDSQGYFCCESVTGSNAPRCGGAGKSVFPADCRNHVNPNVGPPPSGLLDGCYTRNGP